jgi:hypothetical protein
MSVASRYSSIIIVCIVFSFVFIGFAYIYGEMMLSNEMIIRLSTDADQLVINTTTSEKPLSSSTNIQTSTTSQILLKMTTTTVDSRCSYYHDIYNSSSITE